MGWIFVVCILYLLLRTGGIGRTALSTWLGQRQTAVLVTLEWQDLSGNSRSTSDIQELSRVVGFVDYQCYYCRDFHDSVAVLRDDGADEPLLGIRFKVIGNNPVSRSAAATAICAGQQGRFGRGTSGNLV